MLRIKTTTADAPPEKCTIDIRGAAITLYLRPWDARVAKQIRSRRIKGFEWVVNPDTNRREKAEILDNDGFFDDMVDHIIAGFEGVGDEEGRPWVVDLDHKKQLLSISVEKGVDPIWERVLEISKGLAFALAEEDSSMEKN